MLSPSEMFKKTNSTLEAVFPYLTLLFFLACVSLLAEGQDAIMALEEKRRDEESSATLGTSEAALEWAPVDFSEEIARVRRSPKTKPQKEIKTKKKENRRKIAISAVEKIVGEKLKEQLQPLSTALRIIRLDSFAEGILRQLSSIELIQSKLLTEYGELRAAANEVARHTLDLGRQLAGLDERLANLDRQLPHRMDINSGLSRNDFRIESASRSSSSFADISQTTEMLKDALVAITTKISSSERRFKDDLTLLGNRTTEALKSTQNYLDRRIAEVSIDTEQVIVSMEKMMNRSVCGAASMTSSASDRYFRRQQTPHTSAGEATRDELVYLPAEERSMIPAGSLEREERQHPPLITPFSGWIRPVASVSEAQTLNRGAVTRLATEIARQMMNDGEFHEARDCADIGSRGERKSSIYTIYPASCSRRFAIRVWCELEDTAGRSGGGWTVIQRRGPISETTPSPLSSPLTSPAPVDFFRDWAEYKWGFGDLNGEYWLGNEYIHHVTQSGDYDLRIELYDWGTEVRWAQYSHFYIEDEAHNYTLHIGEYTGNAGNSLKHHQGASFSTRDRDNDANPRGHCARTFHGAWWFTSCHESHLNGRYHRGRHKIYGDGINWLAYRGHNYSLKRSSMMIKRSEKGR